MTATTRDLIEQLVRTVSSVLHTPVAAVDAEGYPLSEVTPPSAFAHAEPSKQDCLKVPFALSGLSGSLLVQQPDAEARLPHRLVESVTDLVINQVLVMDSLPAQHELKNRLIHRLLHGQVEDEDSVMREGEILGMNLSRARAVVLIDASAYLATDNDMPLTWDSPARNWVRVQFIIKRVVQFFSLPNDAICAYVGAGEIAILKASTTRDLEQWARDDGSPPEFPGSWSNLAALKRAASGLLQRLQQDTESPITIGIGRYHPGLAGLARSYEDARAALTIGTRVAGPGKLYCLDELGMAALIGTTDEQTRLELAKNVLGPLDSDHELMETLGAFFEEDCRSAATASRLYVHRNTLNYRLEKIHSMTGLDPKRFDDAMLIRFALILRQLWTDNMTNRHVSDGADAKLQAFPSPDFSPV